MYCGSLTLGEATITLTNPGGTATPFADMLAVSNGTGTVLGQPNPFTANSAATPTGMYAPQGVFADNNHIYVADTGNNRVLIWNTSFPMMGQPADLVLGQTSLATMEPNEGLSAPTSQTLYNPTAVYSDGTNLFVADTGNNRVLVWSGIPTATDQAASYVLGQQGSMVTANSGCGGGSMNAPSGITGNGTSLFVADTGNNRINYYSYSGGFSGLNPSYFTGQTSGTSCSAGANNTGLTAPMGLSNDGTMLYVADSGNNRVILFNMSSMESMNGLSIGYVLGQPGVSSTSTGLSATAMHTPTGVVVGTSGNAGWFYVLDSGNNRVLKFPTSLSSNGQAASFVFGQPGFSSNTANEGGIDIVTLNTAGQPAALAVTPTGELLITDEGNQRVIITNF